MELAKQETDPFWRTYALAQAYFAHGDRAEADAELGKMIDTDADGAGSQIAEVYALRKEPDKMFEWLDPGWNTRDPGVAQLLFDPFLHAYKDDPRFIAFAQKIRVTPKNATHLVREPQMGRKCLFNALEQRRYVIHENCLDRRKAHCGLTTSFGGA